MVLFFFEFILVRLFFFIFLGFVKFLLLLSIMFKDKFFSGILIFLVVGLRIGFDFRIVVLFWFGIEK